MTNSKCEAAMWRICYRLEQTGMQEAHQLRSNLNIEGQVLSDAIRTLERTQIITRENGKWTLKDGHYGQIMKINDRISY